MARPIVLSNGRTHVGINNFGLVHDFYFPYVGGDNHAAADSLRHKIGVWVDGDFSWLDNGDWNFNFSYVEDVLIGHITASNPRIGITLEFTDTVLNGKDVFVRSVHVVNGYDNERDIRLFFHQVFNISQSKKSDTIQYLPDSNALHHFKGRRSFVVGGQTNNSRPFDEFAIGVHGIEGHEGVYRDAEDGQLSRNLVEHGSVDSVIGFYNRIPGHESIQISYWIAVSDNLPSALNKHDKLQSEGLEPSLNETTSYWRLWSEKAKAATRQIPEDYRRQVMTSALIVKSHIDDRGGVVASTDTTMLNYSRDSYSYCWPRDGAYALWPLLRMGYKDELKRYFAFCERTMDRRGFVHHKYQPDGAIGSSWHPYTSYNGRTIPPIQEDETAITVFLFGRYYALHHDEELLEAYYKTMVKPMADFMASYIDPQTKLPLPSYDLWERLFLTTTYSTAVTYAGLMEAVSLAEAYNQTDDAVRWRSAADGIYEARDIFYDKDLKSFIKGFIKHENGDIEYDRTVDISSAYGAYMYGLFATDSVEVSTSYQTIREELKTSDKHPGIARFQNDEYNRFDTSKVGNPWFITTLWLAQYDLETNNETRAMEIIDWVSLQMTPSCVLSEQFDPEGLHFISVAPLTWSQAEFINCLLDSINHGSI